MADGDAGVLPRIIQSVANLRHRTNTAATDVSARHRINWVDTATVTWTVTDSAVNEEVAVSATGAAAYTLPPTVPLGTLGYAQATTNQTTMSGGTDYTSLSVAITAGTSRRIKITGYLPSMSASGSSTSVSGIFESTTQLAASTHSYLQQSVFIEAVITPSSGAHTYKLRLVSVDTGTMSSLASSTVPSFILIEDIGT